MVNVNTPILNLPVVVSMTGAEAIPLVQGGTTKYATAQQIANTGTAFISSARTVTAGVGLTGGGALTNNITLSFDPSTLAPVTAMAVTDSFVISSGSTPETVTFPFAMKAINGLTVSPALNLANDKLIVYRAADGLVYYTTPSAIGTAAGNVPAGGTTGQVLSKLSSTNYDTAWTTFAGLSGTLGATNNMVPRASGTGGQTIKAGNFINDDSGNVYPSSSGVGSLGLTTNMWSNLFLASGGVINWNNGNVTLTQGSGFLTLQASAAVNSTLNIVAAGANPAFALWDTSSSGWTMFSQSGTLRFGNVNSSGVFQANRIDLTTAALAPSTTGGLTLGTTSLMWSDLFLKSGGTINWNNGTFTATQSGGTLYIRANNAAGLPVVASENGANDTTNSYYILQKFRTGAANNGAVQTNDYLGAFLFQGKDQSGNYQNGAYIEGQVTAVGASSVTAKLNFISGGTLGAILTSSAFSPGSSGGQDLGTTALQWGNLFLKSGGIVNFNNGNVTLTHVNATNRLNLSGSSAPILEIANAGTDATRYAALQITNANASGSRQQIAFVQSGARVVSFGYEGTAATWGLGSGNATDASWTAGLLAYDFTGSQWKFGSDVVPLASGTQHLGSGSLMWSDLYLKSGGTINFNNGNVTITHSAGALTQTGNLVVGGTISAGTAGSVVGDVIHYNATSGSITLRPVTGALGSSVLTLPAATDTIAVLAASQAFTNKTYNGLTITSSTGTLTVTNGKTLSISNTLTLAGTDSTTMTFPALSSNVLTTGNNATITVGYNFSPKLIGTVSSGTTTLVVSDGNYQMLINGGAFSLSPPAATNFDAIDLLVINGPSAGAITFTAGKWRVGASTGSTFATTVRATATITVTIASPGVVSWTAHGCVEGDPVWFTTSGALPTGITASTVYYVKYVDANSFQLATTPGGSAINTSGSQSGTHTGNAASQFILSVRQIYGSVTYSWYALQ